MSSQEAFLRETYAAARAAGLPDHIARLAVSQAALETRYGKSAPGNNYFGIKAGKSWRGDTQNLRTWEMRPNGTTYRTRSKFRKYDSPEQSFKDWQALVKRRWPGVFEAKTFEEAAKGLRYGQRGGYATDKGYGRKLAFINNRIGDSPQYASSMRAAVPTTPPAPRPTRLSDVFENITPQQQERVIDGMGLIPGMVGVPSGEKIDHWKHIPQDLPTGIGRIEAYNAQDNKGLAPTPPPPPAPHHNMYAPVPQVAIPPVPTPRPMPAPGATIAPRYTPHPTTQPPVGIDPMTQAPDMMGRLGQRVQNAGPLFPNIGDGHFGKPGGILDRAFGRARLDGPTPSGGLRVGRALSQDPTIRAQQTQDWLGGKEWEAPSWVTNAKR